MSKQDNSPLIIDKEFTLRGKTFTVKSTKRDLVRLGVMLFLYLLFLIWVKSWLGVLVIPFIVDNYTTRIVPWKWWKKLQNKTARKVMSWVDAIVFALVAVYFVHLYFFQNYVIPTSSLEKTLLVGDYLFVSKVNYGPRKPQTPLSMPLTQHTLPVFGCKSYIDAVQWDYERAGGFESVDRDDIVVFNYPAGDVATTNPQMIDLHSDIYMAGYEKSIMEKYNPKDNAGLAQAVAMYDSLMNSLSSEEYHALRAKHYKEGLEIVKGNPRLYGEIVNRPVDRRENYVKRCVGLPGEQLEIRDKVIYINEKPLPFPKNVQFNYRVVLTRSLTEEQRNDYGISVEDLQSLQVVPARQLNDALRAEFGLSAGYVDTLRRTNKSLLMGELPLTAANYNRFKADRRLCKSIKVVEQDYTQGIYPLNGNTGWTVDNYGPVWIPKRGGSVELTLDNLAIYERPIVAYEGNSLEVKDGKIFINGKESDSYTFRMDYYWMMGDNRHNSADSRCWGFVPEDHIVGRALFVWLSLDKDRVWFDGKIRWNRMFRSVGSFD